MVTTTFGPYVVLFIITMDDYVCVQILPSHLLPFVSTLDLITFVWIRPCPYFQHKVFHHVLEFCKISPQGYYNAIFLEMASKPIYCFETL